MFVSEKLLSGQPSSVIQTPVGQHAEERAFTGIHVAHNSNTVQDNKGALLHAIFLTSDNAKRTEFRRNPLPLLDGVLDIAQQSRTR